MSRRKPQGSNRANSKLGRLLSSEDKGVSLANGVDGILTKIFRSMLEHQDIKYVQWSGYLDRYVRRAEAQVGRRVKVGFKGNLTKALANDTMSMLNLCRGIQFLDGKSFNVILEVSFSDGSRKQFESGEVYFDDGEPLVSFVEEIESGFDTEEDESE